MCQWSQSWRTGRREEWDPWDQQREPGSTSVGGRIQVAQHIWVLPLLFSKTGRCSHGREERLTTISAGSTLGVSESCTASGCPHQGAHLLWGSNTWGTGCFQERRRDQPIAGRWQNMIPTCRRNGNKSLLRTKHWIVVSSVIPHSTLLCHTLD